MRSVLSFFRVLVQMQRPDLCPLTGHNPGLLPGLLTGHNNLRRRLHLMGLINSPLCRKCGAEEETSTPVLCECDALASLGHAYLGSFILDPENVKGYKSGVHLELQ
jgi:hypothetical protein